MNVTFENLINVWDAQIPNLLVELVNHAVFATDKAGFQAVVTKLSETTDFDKFFAYTKPNGKNIFFERKELDEWKRRNPVPSQRELERQVAIMTVRDHTDKSNHKKKGRRP